MQSVSSRKFWLPAVLLLIPVGVLVATPSRAAETFNFTFDNEGIPSSGDGIIMPPVVGTGTLSFMNDVGDGIFALSDLGPYTMTFTIGGQTFTDASITTPLNEVAVNIFSFGADQRLEFTENPAASPVDGGANGGSLDIDIAGGALLSFEPSYAGGNYEYFSSSDSGNYLALEEAPEPGSLMLLGAALAGLAFFRRRKDA